MGKLNLTKEKLVPRSVLLLGIAMLIIAAGSITPDLSELYIAGSILIGSWLISRSITGSKA